MSVTIDEIASEVGVSRMTVANVLSGRHKPKRADAVARAERISEVAAKLGYRPHAGATFLSTGRTGCIGMLSDPRRGASHLTPRALKCMIDSTAQHGGYLAHANAAGDLDATQRDELPPLLRQRLVDGVILNYTHDEPAELDQYLIRHDILAVWFNNNRPQNAVHPDDHAAARRLTEILLEHGHRRIWHMDCRPVKYGLPPEYRVLHYSTFDRRAGYEQAMREAGLATRHVDINPHWQDGRTRLPMLKQQLDAAAEQPTAIVLTNQATSICHDLRRLGFDVPGQISVAGFFNDPDDSTGWDATHMHVPFDAVAREVVDMLFRKIEDGGADQPTVRIPYGEPLGYTVGPPPADA